MQGFGSECYAYMKTSNTLIIDTINYGNLMLYFSIFVFGIENLLLSSAGGT